MGDYSDGKLSFLAAKQVMGFCLAAESEQRWDSNPGLCGVPISFLGIKMLECVYVSNTNPLKKSSVCAYAHTHAVHGEALDRCQLVSSFALHHVQADTYP